jgi:hypothetical protein
MKKQILILTTALISMSGFSQIQQNDTTICAGETVELNVAPTGIFQSCTGQSAVNYSTWTEIAPTDSYTNIIKEGSQYYLRSQNNVYQSSSLNGPWNSMNFNTQVGNTCASRMLGFDWTNKLFVATCHNDLYAYDNGIWVAKGLSGFGCGGNFIQKLANNRIIAMKAGFLRDLYISDNNGNNWTNVTNVDNDYWDMIVTSNGTIFSCGGSNTPSMTGLIKSTNNGSSFTQINDQLGISYCSGFAKDCDLNIYAVGDDKIFKSSDNGVTWINICTIPSYSTQNPGFSELVIGSNGDFYLWAYSSASINGLFKSSNLGQTWSQITDVPIIMSNVTDLKEIDGHIIISSTQGVFAKSLTTNYNYLWSTGETTQSILVEPTISTTYTLQTTYNNSVSNDSIVVNLSSPPSAGPDQTICKGDTAVLSGSGAVSYVWNNDIIDGEEFVPESTAEYIVTGTDASGCIGIDSVNIYVNNTSASTLTETALDSYTLNGQTYTESGAYTQVIPNAAGCDSTITLNLSLDFTGLQEIENSFTISPNPATDELTITTNTLLNESYILFDPQGRKVLSGTLTGTATELDLSKLASGNYLLQIGEKQMPVRIVKN